MSDAPENVPANSARDRSLLKRLQSITRTDENDPLTPLGNVVSGTGINLIAAAIAANADFSFTSPASAEDRKDGEHGGDGTVNTEAAEGGHAESEGARSEGSHDGAQGSAQDATSNGEPHEENKAATDALPPSETDHANANPFAPQNTQDPSHKVAKHHGTSTSPNLLSNGASSESGSSSADSSSNASALLNTITVAAVSDSNGGSTFHIDSPSDQGQIFSIVGNAATSSTNTADLSGVSTSGPPKAPLKIVTHTGTDNNPSPGTSGSGTSSPGTSGGETVPKGQHDTGPAPTPVPSVIDTGSVVPTPDTGTTGQHDTVVVPPETHISHVTDSSPQPVHDPVPTTLNVHNENTGNGVYVDLGHAIERIATEHGTVTINATALDADGTIGKAIAHIEHVDNVVGTVGNDIIVGNGHANTITYTGSDDAQHAAANGDGTGAGATFGFDIVSGGPSPFSANAHEKASDSHDTLDLSRVGSQEGVAEVAAHGQSAEILPDDAKGVHIDLGTHVTIETINPNTGSTVEITGTLVSTTGGSERVDLALITWAAPASSITAHEMVATIENIIGSHGADDITGNSRDNVYTVVSGGGAGVSSFNGGGGTDTIDFSKLGLPVSGIEVHLADSSGSGSGGDNCGSGSGSGSSVATTHSDSDSGPGTAIVILTNVENVVGSKGNDVIEGNSADNVLTGISGSDMFIFKSTILLDGIEYANIGNDEITDYNHSGHGGSGHDSLWLASMFFHFDGGMSSADKVNALFDQYAHDDHGNTVIRIDDHNSIRIDNMSLNDARLYFSDTFYFI